METSSFDRRALYFTPVGLGGPMTPDVAQRVFSQQAEQMELPQRVPESVRAQFAKVQKMYAGGVFTYENFTSCVREAHRVLEVALKTRFSEMYASGVPVQASDGRNENLELARFLAMQPRARPLLRGHPRFNGSFEAHMSWARRQGLFYGERNRVRERLTVLLRNDDLHNPRDRTRMPPDARFALSVVGEMISALWDASMPTRLWYPGTVQREVMVFGQGPGNHESIRFAVDQLRDVPEDDESDRRSWYVVRVAYEQDMFFWDPNFETTDTPVEVLWGPGGWNDLHETTRRQGGSWSPDESKYVDRLFFVRRLEGVYEMPRTASAARRTLAVAGERWLVVRADSPLDVAQHLRGVGSANCKLRGCECPVTVMYEPSRRERVLAFAKRHQELH